MSSGYAVWCTVEDHDEAKFQTRRFTSGTKIKTEGKRMWFLKKGICKITEFLPTQGRRHYHDIHVSQGAFVGERNILRTKWGGQYLPLMWPKRRYETTTFCEMVEVKEEAIQQIIAVEPSIYTTISNEIQAHRLITELRHSYKKRHDMTVENFWTSFQRCGKSFKKEEHLTVPEGRIAIVGRHDMTVENFWTSFQRCGKSFKKEEHLTVPEGRIAIVGCWTQILLVVPRTAMDHHLHIRGPAKLWVKPADKRASGMVYYEKIRYEDSNEGVEVNSCVSFVHDTSGVSNLS
ncbi:hypothetical protein COOONC_06453 [Cooperia oncophora]